MSANSIEFVKIKPEGKKRTLMTFSVCSLVSLPFVSWPLKNRSFSFSVDVLRNSFTQLMYFQGIGN